LASSPASSTSETGSGFLHPVLSEIAAHTHLTAAQHLAWTERAKSDPNGFWADQARRVSWMREPTRIRNTSFVGDVRINWYDDGTLNASATCLDRHLIERPDQAAIIWEGDDPRSQKTVTYRELPDGPPADASVATPSETLLAALGSCLSAHIHANAALGSIVVHSLELDLEVDVRASPMWDPSGQAPRAVGFEAIRVVVHIQADASAEALGALVAHAVLWSPVANTIHDPVHLDVTLDGTAHM
jgi:uncharacterized OsmC-like protein